MRKLFVTRLSAFVMALVLFVPLRRLMEGLLRKI